MGLMKTCCCWCNVRSGTIVSNVYTLILSILNGCLVVYNIKEMKVLQETSSTFSNDPELQQHIKMACGWFYAIIVVCVLLLITSILSIIAVQLDKKILLIPWMLVTIQMILVDTAALVYECIVFGMLSFNVFQMVIWLGLTVLNVYCLMCVFSHYHNLAAGHGTRQWYAETSGPVYYSQGIQQVHISQGPIYVAHPSSSSHLPNQPTLMTTVVLTTPLGSQNIQCSDQCNEYDNANAPLVTAFTSKT